MANIKKSREERKIAKTFCVTTGPLEIFQETCKKLKTNPSHEVDNFISEFNLKNQ